MLTWQDFLAEDETKASPSFDEGGPKPQAQQDTGGVNMTFLACRAILGRLAHVCTRPCMYSWKSCKMVRACVDRTL